MAKLRSRRRARVIRYDSAHLTNIDLEDFVQLEQMLTSRPDRVLEWFAENGIGCLMDMEMYRRLCYENAEAADRIATVARAHGIPLDNS